jgi:hypothetical protein
MPAAILGAVFLLRAGFPGMGTLLLGHGLLTLAAVCFPSSPAFAGSSSTGDDVAGASPLSRCARR